jgi:hypothetical protein
MITTKNYSLTAFGTGDIYSGSLDKDRFIKIDNQLAFLSDLIEDGKINGWAIYDDSTSSTIKISATPGIGIINRFVTRTFSNISVNLDDNKKYYIYMQRKTNFIGGNSGFSDYAELVFLDTSIPNIPSNLSTTPIDFDKVNIYWDNNTEADLSHYIVQRSEDNINFTDINISYTNVYEDTNLTEDTLYYYQIVAVDKSNNQSLPTASDMSKTFKDLRTPLDARFLMSFLGDGLVQLCWQKSLWDNVSGYEIIVYELNSEYTILSEVYSTIVGQTTDNIIIKNLINDVKYKFVIYAINSNSIRSSGLDAVETPKCNNGPSEIENLLLSYSVSYKNIFGIILNIDWSTGIDPYNPKTIPVKYIITLIENGQIVSDVKNIYNTTSTHFEIYNKDNLGKQILPKTNYIIKIQAENEFGDINNGTVGIIAVGKFTNPSTPSNLNATLNNYPSENNNILFTWDSTDDFQYLYMTIKRVDILTAVETVLFNNVSIGKSRSYLLESSYIIKSNRYIFEIYKSDEFGNLSEKSSVLVNVINNDVPDIASEQIAYNGNNSALLTWKKSPEAALFKIWRANYSQYGITAGDFILIDTVNGDKTTYTDYSVQNYYKYYYFITTVSRNGYESLNPINDDFASYPLIYASPRGDVFLDPPRGLTATNSGIVGDYDVVLNWVDATDNFDGYEIYRSFDDRGSWINIGDAVKGTITFLDKDVLLESGHYYYMIRKFRNEAILFASTSSIAPTDSILISIIDVNFGILSIDNSVVNNIANWEEPINKYIFGRINVHKHDIKTINGSEIVDKRIDLRKNVIIDNWTTLDTQIYITTSVIPNTSTYIVRIDDKISSINYNLDINNKKLIFQTKTNSFNVSIEFINVNETKNILPEDQFININSSFIESDLLKKYQLDKINHEGRIEDPLIPLQVKMESTDNYKYTILQNRLSNIHENIGSSITFYDIIKFKISSDFCQDEIFQNDTCDIPYTGLVNMMLAATSNGLMASVNSGENWHNILSSEVPFKRVFKSSSTNRFIAIAHNLVYVSNNGMNWVKTTGLESISVVRDIVDDLDNVYISTDLGVYYLSQDNVGQFTQWTQTKLISPITSDCYALLYDSIKDRVIVSTEMGLFETKNQGLTWSYTDILNELIIIHKFITYNGFIFALGNNYLYRTDDISEFVNIGYINSDISRNIEIFDNRILIITNNGIYINNEFYNIYYSDNIQFSQGLSRINFSNRIVPVTSLNIIDSNIWIGADQRLFSGLTLDVIKIKYENIIGITPTVYINNKEQMVGFQYDIVNDLIVFDRMLLDDDIITVANQYQIFRNKNSGWIDTKYDSLINIYKDYKLLFSINGSEIPTQQLGSVTFETFTEFNSNSVTANQYKQDYSDEYGRLVNIINGTDSLKDGEQLTDVVYNIVQLYYKCYSQLNGDIRFVSSITHNSNQFVVFNFEKVLYNIYPQALEKYEIVQEIPDVLIFDKDTIEDSTIAINIVNGLFTFKTTLDKYNVIYTNIENTTLKNNGTIHHDELENTVEYVNTGLTTGLTDVQSANIVNTGIFIRDKWDSEQQNDEDVCLLTKIYPPLNAKYFLPGEKDWYDILNSTIDYEKIFDCKNTGLFINYVTSTLHITDDNPYLDNNFVLVGYDNGLIKINVSDTSNIVDANNIFAITKIDFNGIGGNEFVCDLQFIDNIIYVLTENNLYYSEDFGLTWIKHIVLGLNQKKLIKFSIINSNKVITTKDGIYCMLNFTDNWIKTYSNTEISTLFKDNLLFAIAGDKLLYSRDGVTWSSGGSFHNIHVNNLVKYRANILLSTDKGLRSDVSTFYSGNLATSLINIKGNSVDSANVNINSTAVHNNGTQYVAVSSDGNYYISNFDSITEYTDSGLDTIHKVIFVGDDFWMFGFDMLKISSITNPIKISTGIRI